MTLVIGYGNPGRGDDGLGPEFCRWLDAANMSDVTVICDFQLKVEHAVEIATAQRVVFVDAALDLATPFHFAEVMPATFGDVSSHAVSPDVVVALAKLHFGAVCPAYVLAIAGAQFGRMHDGLSSVAAHNLAQAEQFFLQWLKDQPHRMAS